MKRQREYEREEVDWTEVNSTQVATHVADQFLEYKVLNDELMCRRNKNIFFSLFFGGGGTSSAFLESCCGYFVFNIYH